MKFPSAEWASTFREQLNANTAYREAGAAWVGDILLLVKPSDANLPAPGVLLELARGECSAATYHEDARSVSSEFVYEGSRENWQRLFRQELDPVKAIMDGTFRVRGNMAKLLRFTRAAKELVETASHIPAEV